MKKLEKLVLIIIVFVLLLTMLPGKTATASSSVIHDADDALLLMLASHNMLMDGGLAVGNPHTAVVNPQASPNEVDILFDIYAKQLSQLDQMDCSENVKLRLVDELDAKLAVLDAKAQRLEAERQNRRRGGLFRRFFRALGRATGWVVSKAMDASGKIVQYGIEEVGPQLIKDAVFGGVPLTGAAFRAKFMEMLRSRGWDLVNRKIDTRLAALASESESPSSQPDQVIPPDGDQVDIIPANTQPSASGTSSCAPLEILEVDVRKNEELSPDVIVYANGEETVPPDGFSLYYPPLPDSARISQTARVMVHSGAKITVSTTQAVTCAGVLLIGDAVTPASISLDGELVWNGYLYPPTKGEGTRPFRTFYVRFAVEPARPVSVSITSHSTGDDQVGIWVPVEAFGFDFP